MHGGSPGVVPQEKTRLTPTGVVGRENIRPAASRVDGPADRRHKVVGGPAMVMVGGCKTRLPHGKVVSETNCDVEALRRQGVRFEEILPPPPAVEVLPSAELVTSPESA